MPKIRPLRPEHVTAIKLRKPDARDLAGMDLEKHGRALSATPAAVAVFTDDEEIIACVGGIPFNSKSCWVFLLTSELVEKYPLLLVKVVKKLIQQGVNLGMVRFETLVNVADERAIRFVESCNFEREGGCRATGEDLADRYMYARICLPEE